MHIEYWFSLFNLVDRWEHNCSEFLIFSCWTVYFLKLNTFNLSVHRKRAKPCKEQQFTENYGSLPCMYIYIYIATYIEVDTLSYQWLCDFPSFPDHSIHPSVIWWQSTVFVASLAQPFILKNFQKCWCPGPAYGHLVSSSFESEIKPNRKKCKSLCHVL